MLRVAAEAEVIREHVARAGRLAAASARDNRVCIAPAAARARRLCADALVGRAWRRRRGRRVVNGRVRPGRSRRRQALREAARDGRAHTAADRALARQRRAMPRMGAHAHACHERASARRGRVAAPRSPAAAPRAATPSPAARAVLALRTGEVARAVLDAEREAARE